MLLNQLINVALVMACVFIHYEMLRFASGLIGRLPMTPRPRILVVMASVFMAHALEVWMYAAAYLLAEKLGIGSSPARSNIASMISCTFRPLPIPRSAMETSFLWAVCA